MLAFTVHASRDAGPGEAQEVDFIPDGFAIGAFAFGIFWLVFHRLWMALAVALVVLAALMGLAYAFHLHPVSLWGLTTAFNLLLGLEGHQIRRWTLVRHGCPALAVITARNADEAEVRYFTGVGQSRTVLAPASPIRAAPFPARQEAGIGMFPSAGGRA